MRLNPEYIQELKGYIDMQKVPPDSIQFMKQKEALEAEGFGNSFKEVMEYRKIVRNMTAEERKEIFFLRVND